MPAALPDVFQLNVAVPEYGWARAHVLPGARSQNSYCGFGQPVAVPVTVTGVPTLAEDPGGGVALIAVHDEMVSGYWKALNASYELELLASRAHTEKRYEPCGQPRVSHPRVVFDE